MLVKWKKTTGDSWEGVAGPMVVKIEPKADGRWAWQISTQGARHPSASGVANSLGAAKNVSEGVVKRRGPI